MTHSGSAAENLGSPVSLVRAARVLLGLRKGEAHERLTEELLDSGYVVEDAETALEVKARLLGAAVAGEPFDLVVLDLDLPGPSPLETLTRTGNYRAKVILISRSAFEPLRVEAIQLRAVIVDRFISSRDLCECARMMVDPVKLVG